MCLPPHLRTETDPVSETLRSLVSRIPDDGRSQKTQVILSVIQHCQTPLDCNRYFATFPPSFVPYVHSISSIYFIDSLSCIKLSLNLKPEMTVYYDVFVTESNFPKSSRTFKKINLFCGLGKGELRDLQVLSYYSDIV
jgi:hypothetical protein